MKVFSSENDLRAWVCCLLRSEVVDSSRRIGRRVSMMERFKEWVSGPTLAWADAELLEGMAEADRSLLERHYVEGWTQAELAAEAGVSVKAIESRMARLRFKARAFIETNERYEP